MEKNTEAPSKYRISARKRDMSQVFDENAKVIPVTYLVCSGDESSVFASLTPRTELTLIGYSKGKGFAGTMKKWGFHGEPATHGFDKHRGAGSIGAQGVGRVTKFQRMAGRMGGDKKTIQAKLIAYDAESRLLTVSGCVPGARNSIVYVVLSKENV